MSADDGCWVQDCWQLVVRGWGVGHLINYQLGFERTGRRVYFWFCLWKSLKYKCHHVKSGAMQNTLYS